MTKSNRRPRRWAGPAALAVLAVALTAPAPAHADATVNDPLCLAGATASVHFADAAPVWPVLPVVSWSSNLPSYCGGQTITLFVDGETVDQVGAAGSYIVPGISVPSAAAGHNTWTIHLQTPTGGGKDLASATLQYVPRPVASPTPLGTVEITGNGPDQQVRFAQAVQTPGTTLNVASTVNLDLSGLEALPVAAGVTIVGRQDVVPAGPRIFTTTFPRHMLTVGNGSPSAPAYSDHVRITGVRLDGGESDDPFSAVGRPDSDGIEDYGSTDLEIDHNDISHWRGAAINVHDGNNADTAGFVGRINQDNAATVHIHDNTLHHNQHPTSDFCTGYLSGNGHSSGYGVEVADGAYALIERNVFDWNRHDIAGDGKAGSGYFAHDNLLLPNGGIHADCLGHTFHTHAIDMHGVDTCRTSTSNPLADHNCGPAGEYMDISYNTVLYTAGDGIHLRGTPKANGGQKVGMEVTHNVFAHSVAWGNLVVAGAVEQNETGLTQFVNTFASQAFDDRRSCDFDGDGTQDSFAASGAGWWYQSTVLGGRWVFLQRSTVLAAGVTLRDVDGDGRCDETAGGQVYLNPGQRPSGHNPGTVQQVYTTSANVQLDAGGGARPYTWTVTGLPPGVSADATGRITGRASISGPWSRPVTATVTDTAHQRSTVTFTWRVVTVVPSVISEREADARTRLTGAGLVVPTASTTNNCVDTGTVQLQSPSAGTVTDYGAVVNITVSTCTTRPGDGGTTKPK